MVVYPARTTTELRSPDSNPRRASRDIDGFGARGEGGGKEGIAENIAAVDREARKYDLRPYNSLERMPTNLNANL